MPDTYMQVSTFCKLVGHYRRFIKGFANIVQPLYDVLGKEVKMGPVDLPPQGAGGCGYLPVLVFPDFNKPFSAQGVDASKEGLGAMLSQKQGDGCYHPVTFNSCSMTPSKKNYYSSK